jgi:hypothetical protein
MSCISRLDNRQCDRNLIRLLALFLALAAAAPTLLAQERDHVDGPDKIHDPTGAWLIRNEAPDLPFILTVFQVSENRREAG